MANDHIIRRRFWQYDDIIWPFIYAPLLFVFLTHVLVRIAWALGYK